MTLTTRQRVFVEEYLQCWVGTEAATRAGYSPRTANEQAARLLAKVSVKQHIERRISDLKATTDEVLLRLASHSRGNMDDFMRGDYLDLEQARARGKMHLVKKIEITTTTVSKPTGEDFETHYTKLELYDAQAATVQLARILGQFNDTITINHTWRQALVDKGIDPDEALKQAIENVTPKLLTAPDTLPLPAALQPAEDIDAIPPA